ncbi:MAG: hypothetical protein JO072_16880 [Parafilimonas sp.]|nr:hypothetical protein [Parafilimonas sp.]
MFIKKLFCVWMVFSAVLFFSILSACNNSSTSSTGTDTTTVQAAPADSSMQMMDTSKMDTASTRPIRHPN